MNDNTYNGWTNWDTYSIATSILKHEILYRDMLYSGSSKLIYDHCSMMFDDINIDIVNWSEINSYILNDEH